MGKVINEVNENLIHINDLLNEAIVQPSNQGRQNLRDILDRLISSIDSINTEIKEVWREINRIKDMQ